MSKVELRVQHQDKQTLNSNNFIIPFHCHNEKQFTHHVKITCKRIHIPHTFYRYNKNLSSPKKIIKFSFTINNKPGSDAMYC